MTVLVQMTERDLQEAVLEYAGLTKWLAYHTFYSRRSTAGFPDLVLIRDRIVYAELKTTKGRMGVAQCFWRDRIKFAGGEWHLWRPEDWQDGTIQEALR